MLEIKPQQKDWKKTIIITVLLMIIAVGIYILLTVISPSVNLAVVNGKSEQATLKKLEQPVGSNGDRLYIPQINVDVPIVEGNNKTVLDQGAWHRKPDMGNPEVGGNFILSARRFVMGLTPSETASKSPFYNIDKLVESDRLVVDYKGKRYQYVVKKKYPVGTQITDIEASSEEPKLTIYSCTFEGNSDGQGAIQAVPAKEQ